jgi:AcrR family transcriptional regulator
MARSFADYAQGAQQIILAAERLIAERGMDGVSLREILRVAGQANKSAIYHHFGSKDELIQTIYDLRQTEVDARRRERLAETGYPPDGDAAALFAMLVLPVVRTFRGAQLENFARLILHLMLSDPDNPVFVTSREREGAHELNERLRACFPNLPGDVFRYRYSLAVAHFLHGVVQRERLINARKTGYATSPRFWDEMLQSSLAMLIQPFPPLHHQRWAEDEQALPASSPAKPKDVARVRRARAPSTADH